MICALILGLITIAMTSWRSFVEKNSEIFSEKNIIFPPSVTLSASAWSQTNLVSLLSKYGDIIREKPDKINELSPKVKGCFGICSKDENNWNLTLSYIYGVSLVLTNPNTDEVRHENGSYIV